MTWFALSMKKERAELRATWPRDHVTTCKHEQWIDLTRGAATKQIFSDETPQIASCLMLSFSGLSDDVAVYLTVWDGHCGVSPTVALTITLRYNKLVIRRFEGRVTAVLVWGLPSNHVPDEERGWAGGTAWRWSKCIEREGGTVNDWNR